MSDLRQSILLNVFQNTLEYFKLLNFHTHMPFFPSPFMYNNTGTIHNMIDSDVVIDSNVVISDVISTVSTTAYVKNSHSTDAHLN